jgi:NAD(P)-dependent dehydrogenase (short-subunit alcohol dehydrogenase family)
MSAGVVGTKPVAVVTGGGTGLGAGLVRLLARDGFDVVVHYHRNEAGARESVRAVEAMGMQACLAAGDLSIEGAAKALAGTVEEVFGRADLLVNNAGVYREIHGLDLTEGQWLEGLQSTVTQTFFTTRALLPLLRSSMLRRVVNVGDSSCDRPGARDLAWSYHIGKTGVWMLTRSFAASEAPHGVAVNMVSPGFLENSVGGLDPAEVPAGRLGTFADVHAAVRFLALEAPCYLTGSHLMVGGGWNLR